MASSSRNKSFTAEFNDQTPFQSRNDDQRSEGISFSIGSLEVFSTGVGLLILAILDFYDRFFEIVTKRGRNQEAQRRQHQE